MYIVRPVPTPSHLRPLQESELAPQANIDRYLEGEQQRKYLRVTVTYNISYTFTYGFFF